VSGAVIVKFKERDHCIIDKHLRLNQKIEVLAECLSTLPMDSIYIVPAVREFLDRGKPVQTRQDEERGSG
jgi:hypothetical protein